MLQEAIQILLIEDNPGDAYLIQATLTDVKGFLFNIKHADRLSAGFKQLQSGGIDVVVLDLSLPDSTGYDTFRRLHTQYPQVPVVLLTGLEDERVGIEAVREGAQDYVVKGSLDANLLARAIRYALERKRAADALHQSELLFEKMFSSLPEGIFIVDAHSKRILNCNPAAMEILACPQSDIIGKDLADILTDSSIPGSSAEAIQIGKDGDGYDMLQEKLITRKDGRKIFAEYSIFYLKNDQNQNAVDVVIFRDISRRKEAEETLRESEERYSLAVQGANDGLWDWDLRKDEIYYSPRWKGMLGYSEAEISKSPKEWLDRVHPDDRERVQVGLASHLKNLSPHFEIEHRILHRNGTYRWELTRGLAVRDKYGTPYRMAGSQSDITARKNAEEQLLHDAFHDGLTGLANRALFLDRLGMAIEHKKRRTDFMFAVLFLDLDRFKIINDSMGHFVGDRLLLKIANSLKSCMRSGDTLARFGGDEFVILLDDIHESEVATQVAKRIQDVLVKPFEVDEKSIYTSSSIGIVLSTFGYENKEDVLRDADIAMYQAKLLGRGQFVLFTPEMRALAVARLELENDLRYALRRNQLEVYYQPILSLEDEQIKGFEALLRWNHPEKGSIHPAEFIPIAEDSGLIYEIGTWVLYQACNQICRWQEQFPFDPPLQINVNISSRQFNQPEFLDQIQQILRETQLDATSLNLEITESVVMENSEQMKIVLNQLRSIGVKLHIDDFGTGYSSLSYLQNIPVDTLKIDYTFIKRIGEDGERIEIVKTIVALAHGLGIATIAEGVETKNQLERLKNVDCQYGQGFYFAHPIAPDKIPELLQRQRDQLPVDIQSPK